jgi:predicted AAA+ superfamily ATPase
VYYYRTRHGLEVDFVVEMGKECWAVEVKSGRDVSLRALRGVESVAERERRVNRCVAVFLGKRRQRIGRVDVLPLSDFLAELSM